jgi:hypothetical protein
MPPVQDVTIQIFTDSKELNSYISRFKKLPRELQGEFIDTIKTPDDLLTGTMLSEPAEGVSIHFVLKPSDRFRSFVDRHSSVDL